MKVMIMIRNFYRENRDGSEIGENWRVIRNDLEITFFIVILKEIIFVFGEKCLRIIVGVLFIVV